VPYGDNATVRKLIGSPPDSEISDQEIQDAISRADSIVNTQTSTTWASTAPEYASIQAMSEFYAASDLLFRYKDIEKKGDKYRAEFWNMIAQFNRKQGPLFGLTQRTENTDITGQGGAFEGYGLDSYQG
jgi:hypothetical protein